jgi:hypothetical protein
MNSESSRNREDIGNIDNRLINLLMMDVMNRFMCSTQIENVDIANIDFKALEIGDQDPTIIWEQYYPEVFRPLTDSQYILEILPKSESSELRNIYTSKAKSSAFGIGKVPYFYGDQSLYWYNSMPKLENSELFRILTEQMPKLLSLEFYLNSSQINREKLFEIIDKYQVNDAFNKMLSLLLSESEYEYSIPLDEGLDLRIVKEDIPEFEFSNVYIKIDDIEISDAKHLKEVLERCLSEEKLNSSKANDITEKVISSIQQKIGYIGSVGNVKIVIRANQDSKIVTKKQSPTQRRRKYNSMD